MCFWWKLEFYLSVKFQRVCKIFNIFVSLFAREFFFCFVSWPTNVGTFEELSWQFSKKMLSKTKVGSERLTKVLICGWRFAGKRKNISCKNMNESHKCSVLNLNLLFTIFSHLICQHITWHLTSPFTHRTFYLMSKIFVTLVIKLKAPKSRLPIQWKVLKLFFGDFVISVTLFPFRPIKFFTSFSKTFPRLFNAEQRSW